MRQREITRAIWGSQGGVDDTTVGFADTAGPALGRMKKTSSIMYGTLNVIVEASISLFCPLESNFSIRTIPNPPRASGGVYIVS